MVPRRLLRHCAPRNDVERGRHREALGRGRGDLSSKELVSSLLPLLRLLSGLFCHLPFVLPPVSCFLYSSFPIIPSFQHSCFHFSYRLFVFRDFVMRFSGYFPVPLVSRSLRSSTSEKREGTRRRVKSVATTSFSITEDTSTGAGGGPPEGLGGYAKSGEERKRIKVTATIPGDKESNLSFEISPFPGGRSWRVDIFLNRNNILTSIYGCYPGQDGFKSLKV